MSKINGLEKLLTVSDQLDYKVPPFFSLPDLFHQEISPRKRFLWKYRLKNQIKTELKKHKEKIKSFKHGVSIRSSSANEDLKDYSAAGKYLSFNGVVGLKKVVDCCIKIWEDHHQKAPSETQCVIIIQATQPSYFSGVVFQETINQNCSKFVFESFYGSCKSIVDGMVLPFRAFYEAQTFIKSPYISSDNTSFVVHKNILEQIKSNQVQILFPRDTKVLEKLSDDEVIVSTKSIVETPAWIEDIYQKLIRIIDFFSPQYPQGVDIEWGSDLQGNLFLFQIRPLTKSIQFFWNEETSDYVGPKTTIQGIPASDGKIEGIITNQQIEDGGQKILWLNEAKIDKIEDLDGYSGVVARLGGMLSHVAVICRELDLPCVVGVKQEIKMGTKVFLNGFTGEIKILV